MISRALLLTTLTPNEEFQRRNSHDLAPACMSSLSLL